MRVHLDLMLTGTQFMYLETNSTKIENVGGLNILYNLDTTDELILLIMATLLSAI